MPTLRELIDKHGMGQGQRYRSLYWEGKEWFEPRLICPNQTQVIGFSHQDNAFYANLDETLWSLYEEPKKKVTRWLWAVNDIVWDVRPRFYSEEEVKLTYPYDPVRKLEWSATEFES